MEFRQILRKILISCGFIYIMNRILITGASRGLGLEFTKQYLEKGDFVIATCRQPEKAKELKGLQKDFEDNLEIEQLDVTSEKSKEILNLINNISSEFGTTMKLDYENKEAIIDEFTTYSVSVCLSVVE